MPPCEALTTTAPAASGPIRVMLSAITIGAGMAGASPSRRRFRSPRLKHLAHPGDDAVAVGEDVVFEDRAVGDRDLQRADPLYGGLEPREGRRVLGGDRSDLGREAGGRSGLVGDDQPSGL